MDSWLCRQENQRKAAAGRGKKNRADFSICLLLRNKIELQVPPNQKNLLNTQGFSLSFQESHDEITRTKWKQNNLKKKTKLRTHERIKVILWYLILYLCSTKKQQQKRDIVFGRRYIIHRVYNFLMFHFQYQIKIKGMLKNTTTWTKPRKKPNRGLTWWHSG